MKRFLTGFLSTCSTALCLCFFFVSCHSNGTAGNSADGAADTTAVLRNWSPATSLSPCRCSLLPDTLPTPLHHRPRRPHHDLKERHRVTKTLADISALLETKDSTFEVKAIKMALPSTRNSLPTKIAICYNAPSRLIQTIVKWSSPNSRSAIQIPTASTSPAKKDHGIPGHGVDHDTCNMAFGPDGFLYISVGDNHTPMAERKGRTSRPCWVKCCASMLIKRPTASPTTTPLSA